MRSTCSPAESSAGCGDDRPSSLSEYPQHEPDDEGDQRDYDHPAGEGDAAVHLNVPRLRLDGLTLRREALGGDAPVLVEMRFLGLQDLLQKALDAVIVLHGLARMGR